MMELAFGISAAVPRRVFLATADSVIQSMMPRVQLELERQIKVLVLMGHEVVIGAPFVWQSENTCRAITRLGPLIEARLVGLMGRPGISSATDYLEERQADTVRVASLELPPNSLFKAEVPSEGAQAITRSLDILAPLIPRRASVETIFRRSFLEDLAWRAQAGTLDRRIRRGLPTRFSRAARNRAEGLVNHLRRLPLEGHFSRAVIAAAISSHQLPPELDNSVTLRSSGLYHAANAQACDAELFTWLGDWEVVPRGTPYCHQYSISPSNPYLFLRALEAYGVSPQVIDRLPLPKLASLGRNAPEVRAFVDWFRLFVSAVACADPNAPVSDAQTQRIARSIGAERNQTLSVKRRLGWLARRKCDRLSRFIALFAALVSAKTGASPLWFAFAGWRARGATKQILDYLRERCERAMVKPLGDFEVLVIREGLRDLTPLQ